MNDTEAAITRDERLLAAELEQQAKALDAALAAVRAEHEQELKKREGALKQDIRALQQKTKKLQKSVTIARAQKEMLSNEIGQLFALLNYERAPRLGLLLRGASALRRIEGDSRSRLSLYLHYLWRRPRSAGQLVAIAASGYFDPAFYRSHYPDVAASNVDPLIHFLDYGAREARDPSTRFDTRFYMRTYPDVVSSGANPLLHYLRHGRKEGRAVRRKGTLGALAPDELVLEAFEDAIEDVQEYVRTYRERGVQAVIEQLKKANRSHPAAWHARRLIEIGKALNEAGHAEADFAFAKEAAKLDLSDPVITALLSAAQSSKETGSGLGIVREIEAVLEAAPPTVRTLGEAEFKASPAYLLTLLKLVVPRQPPAFEPVPRRICYVLHNTLPYSSGGYGTRSHGMAVGLKEAGYDVVALTRPGYPLDLKPELKPEHVPLVDTIDGVPYIRTLAPLRTGIPTFDYIAAMAAQLEKQFKEHRPELVVAASNFANALPALIAARKTGVPFVYEVRGLWEITRQSKEEEFEDTSAFHVQKILEAEVARQADHVFTLTQALKEELVLRGAKADKVTLAPNSCDPDRFVPAKRDRALADKLGIPDDVPVIGYVGTFVAYEGLEDLAGACGLLKASGLKFRLLLIGNENASGLGRGRISNDIERIAKEGGFADWLIMTGRVPHEEVVKYYTLIDICPFPRKPWPVCEMVSPLKPLEALAMEKAVVVSSVRALAEMIEDGERGLIFEKGSVAAMAAALGRLVENPDERARFGQSGRAWVIEQRTWRAVAGLVSQQLAQIAQGPDKCAR